MIGQTCMQGLLHWRRSEPQGNVFNHARRCITCGLPREGLETRADTVPVGNWERDWQEHVRIWGSQLGLSSKEDRV